MIVMTNGVFDVLHPGHVNLLLECRRLAGERGAVIVLVDDDSKVRENKGDQRPIFTVRERVKALKFFRLGDKSLVNQVLVFYSDEDLEAQIKMFGPDILVKGSDWSGKRVVGAEYAKQVIFYPNMDYSSTSIIDRIKSGPKWKAINRT